MINTKVERRCAEKIQFYSHELICNFVKKIVNRIFYKMNSTN